MGNCYQCGAPSGTCNHTCETYSHTEECCPDPVPIARPVCDMKVNVDPCTTLNRTVYPIPDSVNGDCLCPCGPCTDDVVGFTVEQKAWIKEHLEGLKKMFIPYETCGCEIRPQVGHWNPSKPSDADLRPGVAADGEDPNLMYVKDGAGCCSTLKDSPFLTRGGGNNLVFDGGRPSFFGMESGITPGHGTDRALKAFCCVEDAVDATATIVIAP